MVATTSAPLLQAVVQKLRADAPLSAALTGGEHEGSAPSGTKYPFLTYQVHYAPRDYNWSTVTTYVGIDLLVHDTDQVRARNLSQSVYSIIQDAVYDFSATEHGSSGQTTLYSRLDQELYSDDVDNEGKKIYMVGGLYELQMDQHLS